MNKKFSTLLTAGLLIGGASLFNVDAKVVTPADFLAAIVNDSLSVEKLELPAGDLTVELNGDVDITKAAATKADAPAVPTTNGHLIIKRPGLTITKASGVDKVQFTGRFAIEADGVTISGLNIKHHVAVNNGSYWKTAITVVAKSATITGNTIDCSSDEKLVNGITIFPTAEDAEFAVSGNTINNSNASEGKWTSCGIQVAENCTNPLNSKSAQLKDFKVASISNNTFVNCAADYVYIDWEATVGKYKAAQVTPIVAKDGSITNTNYVKAIVNSSDNGKGMIFNGTAEQLNAALSSLSGETINNVPIKTTEGLIVAGVTPLEDELFGYELIEEKTTDFSVLVLRSHLDPLHAYYAITLDANGAGQAEVIADAATMQKFATNPATLWSMTTGKDSDGKVWFKFKNQEGKELKVGDKATFYSLNQTSYNRGVVFTLDGLDLQTENNNYFGLYQAGIKALTVEELNWYEKDGFSVTVKYEDPEDGKLTKEDIAGNPFTGHLMPMTWTGSEFVKAETTDEDNPVKEFYLKDVDGNYIVAEKYASDGAETAQSTYTFKAVTEKALAHDILYDAPKGNRKYYGLYKAEISAKYNDMKDLKKIDILSVFVKNGWAKIGRLDLTSEKVPTLAASVKTDLKEILVALGSDDLVKPKDLLKRGKFYTVERLTRNKTGKLAMDEDEYNDNMSGMATFVQSYGNVLEGQFALTVKEGRYVFTNREVPGTTWKEIPTNALYYTDKANVYRCGVDTYKIETVKEHAATDGYETLKDVIDTKFYIGFSSGVFGANAWFTENHNDKGNTHTIGLDIDKEKALVFSAKEYAAPARIYHDQTTHQDTHYATDSIYVVSRLEYYDGNTLKYDLDTLKIVSYSFVNQYTEPLGIYSNGNKYESKVYQDETAKERFEDVETAHAQAQHFVLRQDKAEGKYNLRPAYLYDNDGVADNWMGYSKVYAGDATTGILSDVYLYDRTENDLFVIEETEKPMYRRVVNPLDTVAIFRDDNPKSILFESKGFLGMENLVQYPEIAPGMVADTAYVRNDTHRPQYMLVVGPKVTPAGKYCPVHGADADCKDEHLEDVAGWVEGRYLVNLVDTAIAWNNASKHSGNNPYINSEKYYRLGFVQAKHIEDSLIIAGTNDTLIVGTPAYNQAKFAFRYVDTDKKSFRIETANYVKLPNATEAERAGLGWLKWMNGVVVVVDDIKDADIFNMDEEFEGQPTANETIAASEVTVIAGEGQVTIAGAAGKKVVISNILGQVVANTVVASDNAVIAAPAGVVVVAVEGEAAVKAIVK